MFNPYIGGMPEPIRPVERPHPAEPPQERPPELLSGLLGHLGKLDRDDLMMLALIYLLARENPEDRICPLAAIILYCLLD